MLKICRTPGPTACSKTKMLHLDRVCLLVFGPYNDKLCADNGKGEYKKELQRTMKDSFLWILNGRRFYLPHYWFSDDWHITSTPSDTLIPLFTNGYILAENWPIYLAATNTLSSRHYVQETAFLMCCLYYLYCLLLDLHSIISTCYLTCCACRHLEK